MVKVNIIKATTNKKKKTTKKKNPTGFRTIDIIAFHCIVRLTVGFNEML